MIQLKPLKCARYCASAAVVLAGVFVSGEATARMTLTEEQQAYLDRKASITYCVDPGWMPYESINEAGEHIGVSADYIDLLSSRLEVRFDLVVTRSWKETLEKARSRECDMISMARETEERKAYLDFTRPYISFPYVVAATADKPYIGQLEDNLDKSYAHVEGYAVADYMRETYPDITLVPVANFEDGVRVIRAGEAFGYLDSVVTLGYNVRELGILDVQVAGETRYNSMVSIASRNDEPLLSGIMQAALDTISALEQRTIVDRWVNLQYSREASEARESELRLGINEVQYLQENPVARMCVDPDWMPYEAIDQGAHTGIGGDMLPIIAGRVGLSLELVPSDSWTASLELFRAGECDILSMLNQTEVRDTFMDYTAPFFRGHVVFVARNDYPYIADPSEVSGKRIAVVEGYSVTEFLERDFPEAEFVMAPNYDAAFEMVVTGEVDLTADYLISSGERIQDKGYYGLKIAGTTPYRNDLRIGVQKDLPELRAILDKAVGSLDQTEINTVVNKWRTVRYEQAFDYTLLWQVMAGAAVLLGFTGFWTRRLYVARKKTQAALDELACAQGELERLATTDKLTGLYNRNKIDEVLDQELQRARRFSHGVGLILLDMDHFKVVNDTFGHLAGDQALIELAGLLRDHTRTTDHVGRWGGEEFIIICPETDLHDLKETAGKLRILVESHAFKEIGTKTASFGLASWASSDTADSLIKRADDALYLAKEKGRNRVESL